MSKILDLIGTTISSFQLGIGGTRIRNNAGTVEARNAANNALAPFSATAIAGTTLTGSTSCITPLVTTAGSRLRLEQTGDTYGASYLELMNSADTQGVRVRNMDSSFQAVDLTLVTQEFTDVNLRLETRSGNCVNPINRTGSPNRSGPQIGEFQAISPNNNYPIASFGIWSSQVSTELRISGSTSGYNGFKVAAAAGSISWQLPTTDGVLNSYMETDGSGNLSWGSPVISANMAFHYGALVY